MEIEICAVMGVFDSGLRTCREKVHAEARSRGETKVQQRDTEGTEEGFCAHSRAGFVSASPRLRVPISLQNKQQCSPVVISPDSRAPQRE